MLASEQKGGLKVRAFLQLRRRRRKRRKMAPQLAAPTGGLERESRGSQSYLTSFVFSSFKLQAPAGSRPSSGSIMLLPLLYLLIVAKTLPASGHSAEVVSSVQRTNSSQLPAVSEQVATARTSQAMGQVPERVEEEVELSRSQQQQQQQQQQLRGRPRATGGSRIYRIRAAPSNGRLVGPPVSLELVAERPPVGSFGVRSPQRPLKAAKLPTSGQQEASPGATGGGAGGNCPAGDEHQAAEASSVSASSQTLHLVEASAPSSNRTTATGLGGEVDERESLGGSRPVVEAEAEAEQRSATPREEIPLAATGGQRNESILSLVDEFDSKIITNRTKGEFESAAAGRRRSGRSAARAGDLFATN